MGPFKTNRCNTCGRFRPWDDLIQHFVPDTSFSSEDDSWQECVDCAGVRDERAADNRERPAEIKEQE